MSRYLRHPNVWFGLLATVLVAGIAVAWHLRPEANTPSEARDPHTYHRIQPGGTIAPERPGDESDAPADATGRADRSGAATASFPGAGINDLPPGLAGEGANSSIPRVPLTVTVTSREPIRTVGYQVPTSSEHRHGTARGVGTSWRLTTAVYGRPDYARVFLQAGPSGAVITCTITVDGTVTERRSTRGPYGATMCQG